MNLALRGPEEAAREDGAREEIRQKPGKTKGREQESWESQML